MKHCKEGRLKKTCFLITFILFISACGGESIAELNAKSPPGNTYLNAKKLADALNEKVIICNYVEEEFLDFGLPYDDGGCWFSEGKIEDKEALGYNIDIKVERSAEGEFANAVRRLYWDSMRDAKAASGIKENWFLVGPNWIISGYQSAYIKVQEILGGDILNLFSDTDRELFSQSASTGEQIANLASTATPQTTETPQSTAKHYLTRVTEFGDPILLAINDRPPDFQDDFSKKSSKWEFSTKGAEGKKGSLEITNSVLAMNGEGQGVYHTWNSGIKFSNFVLQVDLNTQKLTPGCGAAIQWGCTGPGRIFWLLGGEGWQVYSICQSQPDIVFTADMPSEGPFPSNSSGVFTVTIISKDPEFAIYLDGNPLTYLKDIDRPPRSDLQFGLWASIPDICTAEFDNLKIWNLD